MTNERLAELIVDIIIYSLGVFAGYFLSKIKK